MRFRFIFLFCWLLYSNTYSQNLEISLTKIEKDTIIRNIGVFFKENYVFPDKGHDLQKSLSVLNAKGAFDTIKDPKIFRRTLQTAIRNIIDDKHIIFIYRNPEDHQPFETNTISKDSDLKTEYEHRKAENFGIPELKILENNIGYIKITKFTSPELFGPMIRAGSEFLKNVDGLILDLRSRGGGRSEAVALLLSYFLPYNTHIFDWENREGVVFERNWTLPYVEGHQFNEIPITVLMSKATFSGSEAFCYIMKHHERATLIGETTRGGAHSYKEMYPSEKYLILVPHQRVLSAKTNKNWEGTGVSPTIYSSTEYAMEVAQKLLIAMIADKK
nr:S41 family peptidase [Allomuricauda sp.]